MLHNYIKIAWRNLWKNKIFAFINIFGLSVGIGFLLLTVGYVWQELRVNSIIKDYDRVFILRSKWKEPGMGLELTTPAPIAKALKENYPHLIESFYHHDGINSIVSKGDQHFSEVLQPGDSTFLQIFGFPLLHGDVTTVLNEPNTIVLTAAKAEKYFGKTNVVGETLTLQSFSGSRQDFVISGVLEDLPFNTITNYNNNNGANEFFLSPGSLRFFDRDEAFESWQNPYVISYVKLREGVSTESLQQPIAQLLASNTPASMHENLQVYPTAVREYYLQLNNGAAKRMIYTIGGITLFILLMAIINFVNISISNSLTRLKETGIRKVLGGSRLQIVKQHLTESVFFTLIAGSIALLIYDWTRQPFGAMLGKEIPELGSLSVSYIFFPLTISLII